MYIITYAYELENIKDYEVQISPPAEVSGFFEAAEIIRYHRYKIEYNRSEHEIICPRYTFADGIEVIVIPWFLIPGRPYPIHIYLYASGLYSTNPGMGQRGVAEATRKQFKLGKGKFSHSTVSRSYRAFEESRKQALEHRYGEEFEAGGSAAGNLVGAAIKNDTKKGEAQGTTRRFPKTTETSARRREMAVFLQGLLCHTEKMKIEAASRQFVEKWHKKTGRLLI